MLSLMKKDISAEDGMGPYEPEDVFFVVQGEMEYGNQLGGVE